MAMNRVQMALNRREGLYWRPEFNAESTHLHLPLNVPLHLDNKIDGLPRARNSSEGRCSECGLSKGDARFSIFSCFDCGRDICSDCWTNAHPYGADDGRHQRLAINQAKAVKTYFGVNAFNHAGEISADDVEPSSWLEIRRDYSTHVLQEHKSFMQLTAIQPRLPDPRSLHPSFVSFIGEATHGAAALIDFLIDLNPDPHVGLPSSGPEVASSSDHSSLRSRGIHLHSDPSTSRTQNPILYVSCEAPWLYSFERRQASPNYESSREILDRYKRESSNAYHDKFEHLYSWLLYPLADVCVFVEEGFRSIDVTVERWLRWADSALEVNSRCPIRPYAVLVIISPPGFEQPLWGSWDVKSTTENALENIQLDGKLRSRWQTLVAKATIHGLAPSSALELIKCYFSSFRVVQFPDKSLVKRLVDQAQELYSEIVEATAKARADRRRIGVHLNAAESQQFIRKACDHFCGSNSSPFDLMEASRAQHPSTTDNFTDSGYGTEMKSESLKVPIDAPVGMPDTSVESQDLSDSATIYSQNTSAGSVERVYFVQRIAELIFEDIGGKDLSTDLAKLACHHLGDLLADFALRLGREGSAIELRKAMVFIHKYRYQVCDSFHEFISTDVTKDSDSEDEDLNELSTTRMPVDELIQMWHEHDDDLDNGGVENDIPKVSDVDYDEDFPLDILDEFIPFEENPLEQPVSQPDGYTALVSNDPSYQWLIATLRSIVALDYDDCDTYHAVRSCVLQNIPKTNVIRSGIPVTVHQVIFVLDWPNLSITEEQLPTKSFSGGIRHLLALTGVSNHVQALPCDMYMRQTWPGTGMFTLELIEECLISGNESTALCRRPDGTVLAAQNGPTSCTINTIGQRNAIAEVAEQLAWLGAVLGSNTLANRVSSCTPSLRYLDKFKTSYKSCNDILQNMHARSKRPKDDPILLNIAGDDSNVISGYVFNISLDCKPIEAQADNGNCWHSMFSNLTIVNGFPTLHRADFTAGLEIPLNIMAELIGTRYVNEHAGTVMIKGFSALLAPTGKFSDIIMWHLCEKTNGDHFAYTDCAVPICDINLNDLEGSRHIVGWCRQIRNQATNPETCNKVSRSGLAEVRPGCLLDNQYLKFGVAITKEPSFILLERHKSVHLTSGLYFRKLQYLHQHLTLLWDVSDARGWLINGLDAFLYLVQVYLQPYREHLGAKLVVLLNHLNRIANIVLEAETPSSSKGKIVNTTDMSPSVGDVTIDPETEAIAQQIFSDYTDQLYDAMDKMICMQEELEHLDRRTKKRSLRLLEGWDFLDLTNQHGPKRPRATNLPVITFTWAKFLRSLNVVTLFGQNFNELLMPYSTCSKITNSKNRDEMPPFCQCSGLPRGSFHIAVALQDLHSKLQYTSPSFQKHILVNNNAVLTNPLTVFERCENQDAHEPTRLGDASSHIQMLWPIEHTEMLQEGLDNQRLQSVRTQMSENLGGAIIFGHDWRSEWYLDENGVPAKGKPPDPSSELEDFFHDSGLGSSHGATSSIERERSNNDPGFSTETSLVQSDEMVHYSSSGQAYGPSSVSGGQPVYGNVYYNNITNHHAATTFQSPTPMPSNSRPVLNDNPGTTLIGRPVVADTTQKRRTIGKTLVRLFKKQMGT